MPPDDTPDARATETLVNRPVLPPGPRVPAAANAAPVCVGQDPVPVLATQLLVTTHTTPSAAHVAVLPLPVYPEAQVSAVDTAPLVRV